MIEYKIRPVTRYIVTRYESADQKAGSSTQCGEYDSAETAYAVGYAMCALEHNKSGLPVGSMEFIYPERVDAF